MSIINFKKLSIKKTLLFVSIFLSGAVAAQNVGIGTPTPDYTLDINGTLGVNDFVYHNDDVDTWMGFPASGAWELVVGDKQAVQVDAINSTFTVNSNNDDINFLISSDGINSLFYADTQNDHIGIGNSDPEHLVDIDNGNMLIHGDGINALMFADHSNSRMGIGTANPEHLVDIDNGNMLIHGDGINALFFVDHFDNKIGIGTDTPQAELHVAGTIKADSLTLNSEQLPIIKSGKVPFYITVPQNEIIFTVNYEGFSAPPKIFITVDDTDTFGGVLETYTHSVRNVTATSAEIHFKEDGDGPIYGTLSVNWMAIE